MIHAFWAEMILAGADLKPLDGYDKTESFFDSISCEAVRVDATSDNMWTFNNNTSMGFDVHKTRVAYIEMFLSQVLECISRVPFHSKIYNLLYVHRTWK